ncbi:MAG TPA: DUF1559 domain-containing protein [Gemmataceae bacterium]
MAMHTATRWRGGGVVAILLGGLLLALLVTEDSLPADTDAKAAALPADLAKIPSDGALIVSGRVADFWGSELLKPARAKLKQVMNEGPMKEFQEHFGLPLEQVERMTLLMLSPLPPHGEPLLFVRAVKPYDLAKVVAMVKNAKMRKYKDQTLYVGDKDWTIYPLDDRSLVYGELRDVNTLIDHPQPKTEGNLAAALRLAAGKHSLVLGMNVKLFKDSVGDQLPGQVEPFLPLLQARSATLSADFAADSRADGVLTFAAEKDANAAIKPAEAGIILLRAALGRIVAEVGKSEEREKQEWKDFLHVFKQIQESLKEMRIEQKDAALQVSIEAKIDPTMAGRTLLDAVQKVREENARNQSGSNLHNLGIAMHMYADAMQRMPANALYNKDGKPLLSWRVLLLPYIDQQALFNEFHLNEPWDSEHNKKLLARMPKIYATPQDENTLKEHTTYYQGFVGKNAFFESKQGIRFPADITDGTSVTIMIVEASKAVPWTKPEDIAYDPDKPLPKLGVPGASLIQVLFCDGHIQAISPGITKETLRSLITRNAGDVPGSDL